MIITNKFNLPDALVAAVGGKYEQAENEYRVTSLLNGVRETLLTRRHDHEIEVDVSEMIWAIFGTAVHDIFRRQQSPNHFKEERLFLPVGDFILSGQFDEYYIDGQELNDFKVSSIWKIVNGNFEDWEKQQMIYTYLLMRHGIHPQKAKITALLRDWTPYKARQDQKIPQSQIYIHPITFTAQDIQDVEGFIEERFKVIEAHLNTPDNGLPICTDAERWYSDEKFAVMNGGNKRATKLCDSHNEAEAWIATANAERAGGGKKPNDYFIMQRRGVNKKCLDYCHAKNFCNYYLEEVADEMQEAAIPF